MELPDKHITEILTGTAPGDYCFALTPMRAEGVPVPFGIAVINPVALKLLARACRIAYDKYPGDHGYKTFHAQLTTTIALLERPPA